MFMGVWIVYLACEVSTSPRCVETYEVVATTMQGAIAEAQRLQDDKQFEWLEVDTTHSPIDPFIYGKLK